MELPAGLHAARALQAAGVPRHRVRVGGVSRVGHGLFVAGCEPELVLPTDLPSALGSDCMLGGLTAAAVLGLPIPSRARAPELVVAAPASPFDRRDVVCSSVTVPDEHRWAYRGTPMLAPARLFLDLSARLSLVDLVVLGDAMLGRDLVKHGQLVDAVEWARRRPGVVAARRGLPLLDGRSRSPGETKTRLVLVLAGLPAPLCNAPVFDAAGGWIAEPDLVYEEWRLAYEYDGAHHFADIDQRRRDVSRNENLRDEDWHVIVVTVADERRPQRILDRTRTALLRRGVEVPELRITPYLVARQVPRPIRRG